MDRISKPDTTPDIVAVTQAPFYAPDPDTVLYNMWHTTTAISWSRNPSYYDNPRVDELLDKARDIVDQEERAKLYKEVQAIVNDDAPVIFATEEVGLTPHSKQLSGVSWNVQYLHWLGLYGMWWEGTLPKGSIPAGFSLRSCSTCATVHLGRFFIGEKIRSCIVYQLPVRLPAGYLPPQTSLFLHNKGIFFCLKVEGIVCSKWDTAAMFCEDYCTRSQ